MTTTRKILPALLVAMLALALTAQADTSAKDSKADSKRIPAAADDASSTISDAATRQAQLKRQFETFKQKLALLAARLENGSDKDREKAKTVRAAIKLMNDHNTEGRFETIIRALRTPDADKNAELLKQVLDENKELRKDIKQILALIMDDRDKVLREKRENATRLLEQLKELRSRQARLRTLTEMGRHKAEELSKTQEKLARDTEKLLPGKEAQDIAKKIAKAVGEAVRNQKQAAGKLGKGNRNGAIEDEDRAVGALDRAIRDVEEHLNQIRKEETERRLADLLKRCQYMLALQIEVRDGTVALDKVVQARPKSQPALADGHVSDKLASKEELILKEADRALKILEAEGSAAAFPYSFEEVKADVQTVAQRLRKIDTGKVTVTIENDIIATLEEMIAALKRKMQDIRDRPPSPPRPGDPRPPKPKLVDLIAELKMVHAMQRRINARTELYGKQYKGEQLPMPGSTVSAKDREHYEMIRRELKDLSTRQEKLGKVTRNIAIVASGER
jgi:DNA repair exonuclease SbcCD ATPase subunit